MHNSGRYCGRNCANDDTCMKLLSRVIENETAGHKKILFFQDDHRKYLKHGRFYLAKSLNLSKPDIKLYWKLNFK